jgi:hypothetical protein
MKRREDFQELEASELFCPRCQRSQPVRKVLLIVLPTGNKYDYRCAACGTPAGSKLDDDRQAFSVLRPR